MTTWLPRGLLFAIGMVVLRVVQGSLINASPTNAGSISLGLVGLFALAALILGFFDGAADARASADPDRRRDLATRWLLAGLVAGVIGGLAVWFISGFYKPIYAEGLLPELTAFAAFTALLVFFPAILGVIAGRWLVDRGRPEEPRRHGSDVFTSVHEPVHDRAPSVATGGTAPVAATTTAATAVLDYPEEYSEERTSEYSDEVTSHSAQEVTSHSDQVDEVTSPVELADRVVDETHQVHQAAQEAYEDETEEITEQIREQADRIEAEVNEVVDPDTTTTTIVYPDEDETAK